MTQESFFKYPKHEHGGSHSVGTKRSRRPLATDRSLHITLKSDFAFGQRALNKNEALIRSIASTFAARFRVKIHIDAVCGNHLHFLVQGKNREQIQNFFRVFAGQIAQQLLKRFPIGTLKGDADVLKKQGVKKGCKKNQRTFWLYLIYSRVVSNGPEFKRVVRCIERNELETLHKIAYVPRPMKRIKPPG